MSQESRYQRLAKALKDTREEIAVLSYERQTDSTRKDLITLCEQRDEIIAEMKELMGGRND